MRKVEKRYLSQGVYTLKNVIVKDDPLTKPYPKKEKKRIGDTTIDDIIKVARTCENKSDFRKNYHGLYRHAMKMGWKDELSIVLSHKRKWTPETLKVEALKYKTRGEFMKKNISAYNVALKSGIYDELVAHMGEKKKFEPKTKWTYEVVKNIYSNCQSLKQLREVYGQKIISSTKRNGWHDELSKHFKKEPRSNLKWTFEKVKEEAEKYNSRKEFGRMSPSAYQKALEMNWMNSISTHMGGGYTKWTKEKMLEIISDCRNMTDIKKRSAALYVYITRHKLQKKFFKDYKPRRIF